MHVCRWPSLKEREQIEDRVFFFLDWFGEFKGETKSETRELERTEVELEGEAFS